MTADVAIERRLKIFAVASAGKPTLELWQQGFGPIGQSSLCHVLAKLSPAGGDSTSHSPC